MKPVVAIVGRPNVGKSTLFNVICGERISIVEDTPGVTRDRIYADCEWVGFPFTLIDTGGFEPDSTDEMLKAMREQAQIAMDTADVILFLTDVRDGVTDDDEKVASLLRKSGKPVLLVVNKVDSFDKQMPDIYEFYNLGLGDPIPVSAAAKLGTGDLLDEVVKAFPKDNGEEEEDDRKKIAIVGRPNVGKSSLVNQIAGENRVIVSKTAGTTRDAVDTGILYNGKEYILIDTAGIRRKNKIKQELEHYMILRAVSAIERADVVVLLIDATEGVTGQDAKIAGIAHDRGRGLVIAVNKWDAIEKDNHTMSEFTREVRRVLSFASYAEIVFISAVTGQRVSNLFSAVDTAIANQNLRISTGVLNEILSEATALNEPPTDKGRRLRLYYITQVSVKPPTFILFVNSKKLMHFSYERYIENKIREAFGFKGTPIRLLVRERKGEQV